MVPTLDVVHLLVRYRNSDVDTIEEHVRVLKAHGRVWFGKIGKPVGEPSLDRLRRQIDAGVPTFLFMTSRVDGGRGLRVHRGQVSAISSGGDPPPNRLVPDYYDTSGLRPEVRVWAELSSIEQVGPEGLADLVVESSGRPVSEVLQSTAPFLLVAKATPLSRA